MLFCVLPRRQSPRWRRFLNFCWLSLHLAVCPRLSDPFVSQNFRDVCASHSPGWILGCADKSKVGTEVVGDQKAPFSISTTTRCRGELYSFPWIDPLYPSYVPFKVNKKASSTIFRVIGITRPRIEPRYPGPLANILPTRPINWFEFQFLAQFQVDHFSYTI